MRLSWKRALGVAAGFAMAVGLVLLFMPTPRAVDVAPVLTGPMQVTVDDQGETRSHDRLVVSAPVAGRLMRIELHDGDAVREGQLLARIAPLPLSSREREETSARVASAQAVQREVEQLVRRGEEDLAQARREHERVRKLVQEASFRRSPWNRHAMPKSAPPAKWWQRAFAHARRRRTCGSRSRGWVPCAPRAPGLWWRSDRR
jgi:HlyD family secretion protein